MPVLTIASSKGGPGKTTVAVLLAGCLAADGLKVVALDADPAAAFVRWAKNTYEGPAFTTFAEIDETRLAHLIDAENRADLVVVDTAGFGNRAAAVAMTSADAVLIPTLSGGADITEAEKTVRLAEGLARAARRDIPARVLLNRVKRTQLARHAAREIANATLPMLAATLADLVAYGEMTFSGRIPDQGIGGGADTAGHGTSRTWLDTTTPRRTYVTTYRGMDMKASLKLRTRPSPAEAVRIAADAAPSLPPARSANGDKAQSFNTRLRASTIAAIDARARAEGATLKQVICRALAEAGIAVAPADLEDGTPRRRMAA